MTSKYYPVTIIGGGMVGLSLAVALGQVGIEVLVLDRVSFSTQQKTEYDGRVSALSYGSRVLMENIGVWEEMQPYVEPILDIRVAEKGMTSYVHYDHSDIGCEPMGHIIENRHIRYALHRATEGIDSVTIHSPSNWTDIKEENGVVLVALSDGRDITTSLLVAADGRFSTVRTKVGIDAILKDYGQTAIVATIEHEKPHNGLALEYFMPVGPFAVLPMQGNRSSLVWVEPSNKASDYLGLSTEGLQQQIQERIGEYLGNVSMVGEAFSYPLSLVHAKEYTKGRIALIGDAAHGMHPIAGQGVNLGYRDVAVLADLVHNAVKCGLDPASRSVLSCYEAWRRVDVSMMLSVTDALNALFSNDIAILKAARNAGFALVNQMGPMKRHFMKHAMGIVGELPPLMQRAVNTSREAA